MKTINENYFKNSKTETSQPIQIEDIISKDEQVLFDINDPYFITQKLQEIVIDIKTDIEFSNGLRPEENLGYKTKYTKYNKSINESNTGKSK